MLKIIRTMGDKKHYDEFDVLAEMLEKRDQDNSEKIKDKVVEPGAKASVDTSLGRGKVKRKQRLVISQEPDDLDSVSQFSIHLSRREHLLLKTMSLITGKSVSRQIRDEMADYFSRVESRIEKEGLKLEGLKKNSAK